MVLHTDVAVVGAGPVGATLANLLRAYDVPAVVIDRDAGVVPYPRAVAIDDESLRSFQAAGVVQAVLPDLIQNAPIRYHDSKGRVLAHVRPAGQPFGWPRRNLFYQPLMEEALRAGLEGSPIVSFLPSTAVTELHQDPDGVSLQVHGPRGHEAIRARYVVGADGGRSFVRRSVGVALTGSTAPTKWLVVDVEHDTLDAPYSAVYCDPDRPSMTIPLPYGRRRFEFKLVPGETEDEVVTDRAVRQLLRSFYPDGPLPVVLRARVYWHHSRVASRFSAGRVFLAGDAAHLQPPFFGQGMNSGIRDATNLAWKLAAVCHGWGGPQLLDSYDSERRTHAETMVSFATRIGAMYQPRNRGTEVVRDAFFRGVQHIPGARDYILQMKYKPLPRYTNGIVVAAGKGEAAAVGRMFPQPWVQDAAGSRLKLDDAIGRSFALIGLGIDPADHLPETSLAYWRSTGAAVVRVDPTTTAQRATPEGSKGSAGRADTVRLRDLDGVFRDLRLERPEVDIIVLRPDRYVAAVAPAPRLEAVTARLRALIGEADGAGAAAPGAEVTGRTTALTA